MSPRLTLQPPLMKGNKRRKLVLPTLKRRKGFIKNSHLFAEGLVCYSKCNRRKLPLSQPPGHH
jgi:hypothetical protein